jgi:hypothetical protein
MTDDGRTELPDAKYLARGPHAWGAGETKKQALARCRQNIPWGILSGTEFSLDVWTADPGTLAIDEMGTVYGKNLQKVDDVTAKRPRYF